MTIIRAEIRQWWRSRTAIQGKIYKDSAEIYDDGEDIVIIGIKKVLEGSTFFLVETDYGVYKLEKDEMKVNGHD